MSSYFKTLTEILDRFPNRKDLIAVDNYEWENLLAFLEPRYKYIKFIHCGLEGLCFHMKDTLLDIHVFMKVLLPYKDEDVGWKWEKDFLALSFQTAGIQHQLRCRGARVPSVVGAENGETPYIAMEWIKSQKILDYVFNIDNPRKIASIWLEAAKQVEICHNSCVIHADIKTSNIIVNSQGRVYLCDFGMSRVATDKEMARRHGKVVLTPGYNAPEQIGYADSISYDTDIYQLACTLAVMLTKMEPTKSRNEDGKEEWKVNLKGIPREYLPIVMNGRSANREDRYSDISEMIKDMERALSGAVSRRLESIGGKPYRPLQPQPQQQQIVKPKPRHALKPPIEIKPTGDAAYDALVKCISLHVDRRLQERGA